MAAPAIEVRGVTKRFGPVQALAGIDLAVPAGSVLALLGPNGAGKTTLVRILSTLLRPDGGQASVDGCDVVRDASAARSRIALTGQYAAVDELLTGRENLELIGRLHHLGKAERRHRAQQVLERFALLDAGDRLVRDYSGGMRRRLDLGASLVARAPVLILDEPTTGLDPRSRGELWDFIAELAYGGSTVLLTTQYMEEAERLADHIAVIDHGVTVAEGTAAELKSQVGHDVVEARVTRADLDRAAALLAGLGDAAPQVNAGEGRISIPAAAGARALVSAARRLDDAGISPLDLGIRRPTLDDVFLALTGTPAPPAAAPAGAAQPTPPGPVVATAQLSSPSPAAAVPGPRPGQAAAPPRAPAAALADIGAITRRNLLRFARNQRMLALLILDPVLLLVLFRYLLGGAITVRGGRYVDYLMPGIFVAAILAGGVNTALGLCQDLRSGITDRFRSLPIARSAVLAARTTADLLINLVALGVIIGFGWLVGHRDRGSAAAAIGGIALIALLSYTFSWVFAAIGMALRDPESAYNAGMLTFFLLIFVSSAFVPAAALPGWLQPVARSQPAAVTINAVRALMGGQPLHGWAWQSLAWCAAILAASTNLAVHLYRKTGS